MGVHICRAIDVERDRDFKEALGDTFESLSSLIKSWSHNMEAHLACGLRY